MFRKKNMVAKVNLADPAYTALSVSLKISSMANLEVCIDSVEGLDTCVEAGGVRVELCSALTLGGLTPSLGLMKLAGKTPLKVYAMIRPRAGNFVFTNSEVDVMCDDIRAAADTGLAGVVLGVANPDASINRKALEIMVRAAEPLEKTLHRVVDTLANPLHGIDVAIELGFDRVLSSGGMASVNRGTDLLTKMNSHSAGRIEVMAGAGLTPELILPIFRKTGITSYHSSCTTNHVKNDTPDTLGFSNESCRQTDLALINRYKLELEQIEREP